MRQLESEKLELQLTRGSLRSPTAADSVEEGKLRREAEELSTQKEAARCQLFVGPEWQTHGVFMHVFCVLQHVFASPDG